MHSKALFQLTLFLNYTTGSKLIVTAGSPAHNALESFNVAGVKWKKEASTILRVRTGAARTRILCVSF